MNDYNVILDALQKIYDSQSNNMDIPNELTSNLYTELNIIDVPTERNYWLIRTEGGKFFKDFFENEYVSIGWDEFSDKTFFETQTESTIKEAISKMYPNEKRPGYIFNQLKRFLIDIKKDDLILIPSINSTQIAFGIVEDTNYFPKKEQQFPHSHSYEKCKFKKKIKVKWIKIFPKSSLKSDLKLLMLSHITISNINDYKDHINRLLYKIYKQDNQIHVIFNVKTKEKISMETFSLFMNSTTATIKNLQDILCLNQDTSDLSIKTNVQSPGSIEIIGNLLSEHPLTSVVLLALILNYIVGGNASFEHSAEKTTGTIGSDGILEKFLKFLQEKNKQKNIEAEQKFNESKNDFENVCKILEIDNSYNSNLSLNESSEEYNQLDIENIEETPVENESILDDEIIDSPTLIDDSIIEN